MRLIRRLYRILLLLLHVPLGVLITLALGRPDEAGLPRPRFRRAILLWYRAFCWIMGLRIHVQGEPSAQTVLSVSNHVSWLDIPVLGAHVPAGFLSKSEVRQWPVIGWLAQRNGTVFIRRGEHGAANEVTDKMTDHLKASGSVHVFPEGTTTVGESVRRFHYRLFSAAQRSQCPVQPVGLYYRPLPDGSDSPMPFVNNDKLVPHTWRVLGEKRLEVDLVFKPLIPVEGADRRTLARTAEQAVAEVVMAGQQAAGRLSPSGDSGNGADR
ncbi:1-acyl-sn-glycerol-3-phosphate acyltransferase [Ectothiorhodospira haloalkaliphila]|uniref:lysophospholipid acyltransferase family protein n=1 Tax=Ectothiorhodospira haloalkaliphila TaxID=421628 RepID=UPI001EE8733C|nr:lysophospholipid acyltransferase family protein [Ectothiorhodospira haloalkaliphila]MCG5523949.1 1-acyl-sn-glycerol-3-phosphate acyltransferase [Ectothiorhodospira haloalkaliphila]